MNLKVAAIKGIIWVIVERWGQQALGLAVFTSLARLLDRETFGLVALAGVYISFLQMFVTQGMGTALVQRKDLKPPHLNAAFWVNITAAVVFVVLTVTLRSPLAAILKNEKAAPVLAWLSLGMLLVALTVVPVALLEREMKFKSLAIRTTVGTGVGGCVGVASALLGFGVWSLVAQQLAAAATGVACLWTSVKWRPGTRVTKAAFIDLAPFSLGVLGNNLLWFISTRIDQVAIGTGLGVAALGAYAVAQRIIAMGIDAVAGPAQAVAMPAFSRIQDDLERFGRVFISSTSLLCALVMPAFIGLLLIGPYLIPLVFGAKWEASILPMQILCVAGMLRAFQTFAHPTYMALGRVGLYTLIFVLDAGLSGIGCWLASRHGVAAVAFAVVVAAGLTGVANFLMISGLIRFSFKSLGRAIWPILVASASMTICILGVERLIAGWLHDLITVSVLIVVGVSSYCAVISLLARELWIEFWSTAKLLCQRHKVGTS